MCKEWRRRTDSRRSTSQTREHYKIGDLTWQNAPTRMTKTWQNRSWHNRCQFRRENVKDHNKMLRWFLSCLPVCAQRLCLRIYRRSCPDQRHGTKYAGGEWPKKLSLSRQQGSETSIPGVAKMGPFENSSKAIFFPENWLLDKYCQAGTPQRQIFSICVRYRKSPPFFREAFFLESCCMNPN